MLSHLLVQRAGGDQQAQPLGRASGIYREPGQHFQGIGKFGPETGAVDLGQPLMGQSFGLGLPAVGVAEPGQEDPAGTCQRGVDGFAPVQRVLERVFRRAEVTRLEQQGGGREPVADVIAGDTQHGAVGEVQQDLGGSARPVTAVPKITAPVLYQIAQHDGMPSADQADQAIPAPLGPMSSATPWTTSGHSAPDISPPS